MALVDNDDNRPTNEKTRLLLYCPSPSSTGISVRRSYSGSISLTSSYEDIEKSLEQELHKTLGQEQNARSPKEAKGNTPSHSSIQIQGHHAIFMLFFGCTLSVAVMFFSHTYSSANTKFIPSPTYQAPLSSNFVKPFSEKHPSHDLGLLEYHRPQESSPPKGLFQERLLSPSKTSALPTNAWYQNMLLLHPQEEPSNVHRAYASPFLVDCVGLISGLRIHDNFLVASTNVVQLSVNEALGLTLGAAAAGLMNDETSRRYMVGETTELGVTLHWDKMKMSSTIVRGMVYSTMVYHERSSTSVSTKKEAVVIHPTIASAIPLGKAPLSDGINEISCSENFDPSKRVLVEREIELYFADSDSTWLVFVSEPVWFQCQTRGNEAFLQVVGYESIDSDDTPFIIRAALLDSCTTGRNQYECQQQNKNNMPASSYREILQRHKDFYPGTQTSVQYEIQEDDARLIFNWDVQKMSNGNHILHDDTISANSGLKNGKTGVDATGIISFALPHHLDQLEDSSSLLLDGVDNNRYCKSSMSGFACLVQGNQITIAESLPRIGLRAPRSPKASFIPLISDALVKDLDYQLPTFFQQGAGDTYFSGKMLSKLARILVITEEILELCSNDHSGSHKEYMAYCQNTTLPSASNMTIALDHLQNGVEIWINGSAVTPFVYDVAWGGLVSCGCRFNGDGCDNKAPDCPAFSDQGLNFGNAFYNDQHFHYGYHIYSAAIVAHFRPEWGKKFYEQVLLLIRSIANPSKEDGAFPLHRHKDWYKGSSWASGVPLPPYLNGKNQESSSEAIAAYEAVALYGQIMSKVWYSVGETTKASTCTEIQQIGKLLTATELRSTRSYWHVIHSDPRRRVYPEQYAENVVGIVWQTMVQFGTWFGAAKYLPYGIQLLPLTPISEERDDLAWVNEIYNPFSSACAEEFQCTEGGWVVLQLAILATVGYAEEAASRTGELPDEVFTNAGGNGHSRSNTLWYLGTRPNVQEPIPIAESDLRGADEKRSAPVFVLKDCHVPETCTDEVLNRMAGDHSCRDRISWLISSMGKSQWEACSTISGLEFPQICGPCKPGKSENVDESNEFDERVTVSECPSCTQEECNSKLNRCPVYDRTFVCTKGPNTGGCSGEPWSVDNTCESCCEMTVCQGLRDHEAKKITQDADPLEKPVCPPCTKKICYGKVNQCPLHQAPYICTEGDSIGGCSSRPWDVSNGSTCSDCCEIKQNC